MNNATAITAVYRAIAHYRRRISKAPKDHSAREIVQMSMLAEYLHEAHTHGAEDHAAEQTFEPLTLPSAA